MYIQAIIFLKLPKLTTFALIKVKLGMQEQIWSSLFCARFRCDRLNMQ